MNIGFGTEAFGIAASIVVMSSFFFQSEKYLRIVNLIGAIMFIIYGALIGSIANILTNSGIILAHTIRYIKTRKKKE